MDLGRELRRLCDLLCGPDRAEIFSDLASRLRHGSGAGRARLRIDLAGDVDGLSGQDQGGCRPVAPDPGAGWRRPVTAPSMGLPMPLACGLNPPPNDSRLHRGPMNEHVQTATTEPLFNPLSPEFIRDPYPHYERLRTTDPIHLTPHGMFVASRHAEASLVLGGKRFGKDYVERSVRRYGPQIMEE